MAQIPEITGFGLQSGSTDIYYVTWSWTKTGVYAQVDHFNILWKYATGDGIAWNGTSETLTVGEGLTYESTYTPPDNATKIIAYVQAVSKENSSTSTKYFTDTQWASSEVYKIAGDKDLEVPSVPTVSFDAKTHILTTSVTYNTSELENDGGYGIEFYIKNATTETLYKKVIVPVNSYAGSKWDATYSVAVPTDAAFKVCCRLCWANGFGELTEYSDYSEVVYSGVKNAAVITNVEAISDGKVTVTWERVFYATTYSLQKIDLTSDPSGLSPQTVFTDYEPISDGTTYETISHFSVTIDLDKGSTYGLQLKYKKEVSNGNGTEEVETTDWSDMYVYSYGDKPEAPTTWSDKTVVTKGGSATLYFVHNSSDGSKCQECEIQITIGKFTETITQEKSGLEKDGTIYSYTIDTASTYTSYLATTPILKWKVRTKGVTDEYGDWSVERQIKFYTSPTLSLNVNETMTSYPLTFTMDVTGAGQSPVAYQLYITANESYTTHDNVGEELVINAGDTIWSETLLDSSMSVTKSLTPANVTLESSYSYVLHAVVDMDSGLTAENEMTITCSFTNNKEYLLDAEIGIENSYSVSVIIRPYAVVYTDATTRYVDSELLLSVYRKAFDGEFVEIISGMKNSHASYVVDPHPPLDYARYRIVAENQSTGRIDYLDIPEYTIREKGAIIQWDEKWMTTYEGTPEELGLPSFPGSMVKLMYNIDVSEESDPDVTLVKYIGRTNPVSYYGTQIGQTTTWNMDIPVIDRETLYQLRRLQRYMGDVYVREPFGIGYWATVKVSFSHKHTEMVRPVTISITRVEGGM